jgi:hypothetical protein
VCHCDALCNGVFVLKLTFVILGVLVALLGGVLALWPMHQAWLERLVAVIRRSLVLPFLVAFVIVVTMTTVIAILPLVVVAVVLTALPAVATVTSVMLFCHKADILIVPLAMFVMHLASHALFNLTLAFLCQVAICYLQIKDFLEVLCNRLEHLIAKTLAALDVLCPVLFVEGHIKPPKL